MKSAGDYREFLSCIAQLVAQADRRQLPAVASGVRGAVTPRLEIK